MTDFFKEHGRGIFISTVDNSVFEGEWLEGLRHGKGTLKVYDGTITEQNWVKGSLIGKILSSTSFVIVFFLLEGPFGDTGSPVLPTLNLFKL